jgi:hypothetical protein
MFAVLHLRNLRKPAGCFEAEMIEYIVAQESGFFYVQFCVIVSAGKCGCHKDKHAADVITQKHRISKEIRCFLS